MFTLDQRREVGAAARAFNLPEAHVLAVTEVESAGVIFATVKGEQRPLILFEPHIFYRRLKGAEREEAVALKLASERWDKTLYPAGQPARWAQLERAAEINRQAAYESASYGVGQVMGFHWKALGYASVFELVDRARSGLGGQVELMLRFVQQNNLTDELATGQWAPFARGYNGASYKANRYDEKMAAAAAKFGGLTSEPNGLLRMGSKGRRVRELQALLIRAGYTVKEDGDFGTTTKAALVAFQTARGLTPDGIYGPQTESALGELRQASDDRPGKQALTKLVDVQKGVGGGLGAGVTIAGAKEVLQDASYQVASLGVSLRILDYVQTGLTIAITGCAIAGLGYAAAGWWKSKQTVEA
ncbi:MULTISPECIES: N-acetylmuramidase domain-containing protein [unclassified Aureimonas]|uniref:N-acetylmuramidase domain-containing protein n=1 Tax=unclassified Aureimonas TaxID=2615206 RepID=UPI0006FDF43E|nr:MULTISPECIES: N-acetylmuramidase domain-containing protein [unclassified Aureimonas]KQT52236.1 hypothetical protein ASG62_16390 [Aureimonas sp. Leaf427]KQT70530.1 hypothetical protein ASG54_21560 [Aureimonas sp. Leaf460]